MKIRWTWIMLILLATGCGKQIPDHVIAPEKMETVLYDYHLTLAMSNALKNTEKEAYKKSLFQKHQITEAEFDSSMVWYTRETKMLTSMYERLNKRFTREYNNVEMKIQSRQEASAYQFASGDSVDIWTKGDLEWMTEAPLHHLLSFEMKTDTTFHEGDTFLWEADFHFVSKGKVLMGINMLGENKEVAGETLQVDSSGHHSIYLKTDTAFQVKTLNGFIFVPEDSTTHTHVLVHNISLTRYHMSDSLIIKKEEQPKNNTKADLKIRKEQKLEKEEPAVQEKAPAPNQRIKPMRKKQDDTTQPVKMDKR